MLSKLKIPLLLITVLALTRFVPHPPNATAILALALFGGATVASKRNSLSIVLIAMLLSDLFLGFHSTIFFVYGSIALLVLYGSLILDIDKASSKITASIAGSLIFFAVTNFGVWLVQDLYPKTTAGLEACFVAGIPFLFNMILSTTIYLFAASFAWKMLSEKNHSAFVTN